MVNDFKGVNTVEIEEIRKALKANATDVYKVLKKLDGIVKQYNDCFVDDIGAPYQKKYEQISAGYYTIYENLVSISEEFARLNRKYIATDTEVKTTNNL